MIKLLYKNIRLYFINKKIKKLHYEIETKKQRLTWIKNHIHDIDIVNSTTELNYIKRIIKIDEMMLDSYKQDRDRIKKL